MRKLAARIAAAVRELQPAGLLLAFGVGIGGAWALLGARVAAGEVAHVELEARMTRQIARLEADQADCREAIVRIDKRTAALACRFLGDCPDR